MVVGLPPHETGGRQEGEPVPFVAHPDRRRGDVATGPSLEIARHVKRVLAQRRKVAQGVVAVTVPLDAEDRARFPGVARNPERLRLAERCRSGVERTAGEIVHGESVPLASPDGQPHGQSPGERSGHRPPHLPRPGVAERRRETARPAGQRGPGARDVDDAAQGVAAEQRALRPAHELDLFDIEQLDVRRVGVELRHAIDVGRHARIGRARADPADERVADLPSGQVREVRVRGEESRLADRRDSSALEERSRRRRSR